MNVKLCPFCGGPARIVTNRSAKGVYYNETISEELTAYCNDIGLSIPFLIWMVSSEKFAERFPQYSPLLYCEPPFPLPERSYYTRMDLAEAYSLRDAFHIQKDGMTVVLCKADLQFLKYVQDRLLNRAFVDFHEREIQMEKEVEEANRKLWAETSEGWMSTGSLPPEKLLEIDSYMKYVIKEDDDDGKT